MNPFRMLVLAIRHAVRAAVRSEVEKALADRRAALRQTAVDDAELNRIRTFLHSQGLTVREPATVIPFPANDLHQTTPTPPSAA